MKYNHKMATTDADQEDATERLLAELIAIRNEALRNRLAEDIARGRTSVGRAIAIYELFKDHWAR